MTTTALRPLASDVSELYPDLVPVRDGGILARVKRPCTDHGCDCTCLGHLEDEGCLVFHCPLGDHIITSRVS